MTNQCTSLLEIYIHIIICVTYINKFIKYCIIMIIGNSDIQHGFNIKGELHKINHTIKNTVYILFCLDLIFMKRQIHVN